jgi:hypothetical protein
VAWGATGFEYGLDADTLALWHFNEKNGDEVGDESGNGVEATIEGVATWDDNDDWNANGANGRSFSFDGATQLAIPNAVDVVQPDLITVEAWVYPTDLGGWKLIAAHWGGAIVGRFHLGVEAGVPKFHVNAGGAVSFAPASGPLELEVWTHVAGTADGSDVRIYINGEEDGSAAAKGDLEGAGGGHDVIIGAKASREFQWVGLLDEVRISGRARDPEELSPNLLGPAAVDPAADTLPVVWAGLRSDR